MQTRVGHVVRELLPHSGEMSAAIGRQIVGSKLHLFLQVTSKLNRREWR